ncbi:DUF4373 domain-containing protein [Salipaludibacillus sp. CF4.18]|uniref:DUF4373 domain-containing protein n=1 Tax=Salipaludibacillus sp. CF4.18 TaxID=3373081 RepID=UPI003EE61A95
MARPTKIGLDYFPLYVNMGDEFELIEAEYGLEGFAILIKMYQKICSSGYFVKWEKKDQILFCKKVSLSVDVVNRIINDSANWGIFDSNLFNNFGVITSKDIQETYVHSTYKRKKVEMLEEYLLTDVSDTKNIVVNRVSDIRNSSTNDITDGKSTQRKVKENKENNSKEKEMQRNINSDSTSIYNQLANRLYERILINDDGFKVSDFRNWVEDIKLIIEQDGRPKEEVKDVIDWSQKHSFWKSQILSGKSLRGKMSPLIIQMNEYTRKKLKRLIKHLFLVG